MSKAEDLLDAWGDDVASLPQDLSPLPKMPNVSLPNILGGAVGTMNFGAGRAKSGSRKRKYDLAAIELVYICGERKTSVNGQVQQAIFPTMKELADRAGCSHAYLKEFAASHNWVVKRDAYLQGKYKPAIGEPIDGLENTADESDIDKAAKAAKRKTADAETILLAFIEKFSVAVELNKVKCDSMADLERAIRLLAFVRGQAESTKHVKVTLSLDELSKKHSTYRANVRATVDDRVAGVLAQGDAIAQATTVVMREDGSVVHVAQSDEQDSHESAAE